MKGYQVTPLHALSFGFAKFGISKYQRGEGQMMVNLPGQDILAEQLQAMKPVGGFSSLLLVSFAVLQKAGLQNANVEMCFDCCHP